MQADDFAKDLLSWYDRQHRRLPWRAPPGKRAEPYQVWLSEIMLQQTTVVTVQPYFQKFLQRWPSIADLAAAPVEEVMEAWAGLGYYARARNLHAAAKVIAFALGGRFPEEEAALLELPGVGAYTAAAIAAIAFDRPAAPVDGNWERVVARLFVVEEPLPGAKAELRRLSASLVPQQRPGDFAQAMMDLGATVCQPARPRCLICPVATHCAAHKAGIAESLPRRAEKKARPLKKGVAFWLTRADGAVLLRRRPAKGLLGGMMEVPSTPWRAKAWSAEEARRIAPASLAWRPLPGLVRHGFTHFELELKVMTATWRNRALPQGAGEEARFVAPEKLAKEALPSLMRKVIKHALAKASQAPKLAKKR